MLKYLPISRVHTATSVEQIMTEQHGPGEFRCVALIGGKWKALILWDRARGQRHLHF